MPKIKDLLGLTLSSVRIIDETIMFTTSDGAHYELYHEQDCCEEVYIESVVGDLNDLIGTPLLVAEESCSNAHPDGGATLQKNDSFTWTFYKFATIKGWVDVRWYGESNGYYSEKVNFRKIESHTF